MPEVPPGAARVPPPRREIGARLIGDDGAAPPWSFEESALRAGVAGDPHDGRDRRTNRRGELTREKIVGAAAHCFAEYGYSRTRISDITHQAQTSQGNFYRHFSGLDEIFLAVLRPGLEDLARASRGPGRQDLDLDSLIEASTSYLSAYNRHRAALRLLREAAAASGGGGFQTLWLDLRQQFVTRTERWLSRMIDRGEVPDACNVPMLAETLGCLTEQMAYIHIGLAPTSPRRERVEELGRALGEAWFRTVPRTPQGVAS